MTAKPKQRMHFGCQADERLFTLDVILDDGPMTEAFMKANKKVSRRIDLRGDNTLSELHDAIFEAFGRDDPHMFEFRLDEKKYMEKQARRYVLPEAINYSEPEKPSGDVTVATIGSLGLKEKDRFHYWFDFGDDWRHKIKVVSIADKAPEAEKFYPKITARTGDSPPQYPEWDDEE